MRFGVREIANVVFKAKSDQKIGNTTFVAGQPVLYIDSATASTLEGAATTVYAQGGRGNVRLVTWEGEKTLTFTVTDALLSPVGFAILSGAGLFKGQSDAEKVHVHMAHYASVVKSGTDYIIDISEYTNNDKVLGDAPFFVLTAENGSISGNIIPVTVASTAGYTGTVKFTEIDGTDTVTVANVPLTRSGTAPNYTYTPASSYTPPTGYEYNSSVVGAITNIKVSYTTEIKIDATKTTPSQYEGSQVFIDYYIEKSAAKVSELQIDAEHFAGNYYVEAETLFRRESDGVDMPAIITLPNVKIQSNFTFSMASTGDPSTFDFTMDALPGYTYFKKDKKVLCVIQIVEDTSSADDIIASVMPHPAGATGTAADGSDDEPKYFYEMDTTGNVTATYNDINKDSVATNDTQD